MSTSQKIEFLPPVLLKRAASALGVFEGYASTFGGDPDSHGDVIAPGAFAKSLQEHASRRTRPAMLWAHDSREPIGSWTSLAEDAYGLKVHGKLTLASRRGEEAFALMKDDAVSLSIGYRTRRSSPGPNGARILQDIELWEISVVSMPANTSARITSVKSDIIDVRGIKSERDFERMLIEIGFSRAFAKTATAAGFNTAANASSTKPDHKEIARKLLAAANAISRKG
ncbi:HK97 family phage prohead protease [Ciceribacter sp. RN22]|uniref:HK97 family phage prohead protease n=1 Tax=Ciceribacter sp. RN22 TaxID=2954932 RepID=UPI0020931583|nr:HK97 family phage prohead protease [Ciceribacter sp. RN22]MCO6180265.1 HK97 family phage prohead protease [Ciceribacter sp. RN22]